MPQLIAILGALKWIGEVVLVALRSAIVKPLLFICAWLWKLSPVVKRCLLVIVMLPIVWYFVTTYLNRAMVYFGVCNSNTSGVDSDFISVMSGASNVFDFSPSAFCPSMVSMCNYVFPLDLCLTMFCIYVSSLVVAGVLYLMGGCLHFVRDIFATSKV